MAKKKLAPVSIADLISPGSDIATRQAGAAHLLNLSRAQQILTASMATDPFFNAGDPNNGGVQFKGQTAAENIGAVVQLLAEKQAVTKKELEAMGVRFDDPAAIEKAAGAGLPPPPNRKARRAGAKKRASKRS